MLANVFYGATDLLAALDDRSAPLMFWYLIVFEVPRYLVSLIVLVLAVPRDRPSPKAAGKVSSAVRVSIVIAGHNEAGSTERCLLSLAEQTRRADEIIVVDDGSTDGMRRVINRLRRDGLIDAAFCNQLRCGKAAACNLAIAMCSGDIIINLDIDCSYDRDAIENILAPFSDPCVGATCGNIGVRNSRASLVASYQTIEYLIAISLGKRVLDRLGLVACASGAFGAFRRSALAQVGSLVPGPGEDLDLTLRLRRAGWTIRFCPDAWCMTDTPSTMAAFTRQRRRWDRDTVRIRLRKFRDTFSGSRRRFNATETWEQVEYVAFTFMPTVFLPFYILSLLVMYGLSAVATLIAVAFVYAALDVAALTFAVAMSHRFTGWTIVRLLLFAVTYGVFQCFVARSIRLWAYCEEWIFWRSRRDSYVPQRVLDALDRSF